ncbi:MAG: nucleotidyltransferase domain-containing protein [Desulfurococcaceae archaeon]
MVEREEMFKRFIDTLCRSSSVKEVYLVGSRARGDHTPSSDFDIAVVTENDDIIDVAEHVSSLRKEPVPLDVIVLRREDLENPLYKEMLRNKRKLC